jgi:hypothetical protein
MIDGRLFIADPSASITRTVWELFGRVKTIWYGTKMILEIIGYISLCCSPNPNHLRLDKPPARSERISGDDIVRTALAISVLAAVCFPSSESKLSITMDIMAQVVCKEAPLNRSTDTITMTLSR